jgi:HD-like signal output (HDOD) protein
MGSLAGRCIVNTGVITLQPPNRAADMNKDHIPAFTLVPEKRAAEAKQPAGPATPRFIDDVAAGRVELPTIPGVVQRLIKALRDPDVDARRIGEALSRDPVLSAKVLRVANSAFFGGQRSMASIDAAVAMIGTQALYKLVVACGVEASFEGIQSIDLRLFWRDALVAATAASKLAPRLAADPEAAYLCGLLHATGHLILCRSYPDIANAMFAGFAVVRGAELASIELEAFGIDHPAVGALWVESLGFPRAIAEAVGSATRPLVDVHEPLDLALRSACSLAAAVARNDSADVALATLPPGVRAQYLAADGEPDAAFNKLYEALLQTEPAF